MCHSKSEVKQKELYEKAVSRVLSGKIVRIIHVQTELGSMDNTNVNIFQLIKSLESYAETARYYHKLGGRYTEEFKTSVELFMICEKNIRSLLGWE